MKYKYYWDEGYSNPEIIELEEEYYNSDEAAKAAAKDDLDNCDGAEREGNYPILVLIDENDEEERFKIELEYDPVFYAYRD